MGRFLWPPGARQATVKQKFQTNKQINKKATCRGSSREREGKFNFDADRMQYTVLIHLSFGQVHEKLRLFNLADDSANHSAIASMR